MNTERKFLEILTSFSTAMLTTRCQDGLLTSRPMAVAKAEEDGDLWFITDQHSGKMDDLEANPLVAVTMQSSNQYLSMSGRAKICNDREKIRGMWDESWKVWFPEGKDDPELSLLHIMPLQGEYWDNSGVQGLKYLFKAGKAYLQGTTPDLKQDINAKVTMASTWID